MEMTKRVLLLLLTIILSVGMMCGCSNSQSTDDNAGIKCAATETNPWKIGATAEDSVTAYIDGTTLWISGEGEMADYADPSDRPWNDFAGNIDNIFLDGEVESVGQNAFNGIGTQTEGGADIFFGAEVEKIGPSAFEGMKFADYCILTLPDDVEVIGSKAFADCSLTELHFDGKPDSIADDVFAGSKMSLYVRNNENWTDADKGQFGGELTYKTLYMFKYECVFEDDDMSSEGEEYADADMEYTYDANIDAENLEGIAFDHYEIVKGVLKIDPKEPMISTRLTSDVEVKIYYKNI